jgi:hypothetical protein
LKESANAGKANRRGTQQVPLLLPGMNNFSHADGFGEFIVGHFVVEPAE